jgi:phenylalanyl-tRNA synthetase alpha chain
MWNFDDIQQKALQEIDACRDLDEAEALRVKYLGRKGLLPEIFASLSQASPEEKPLIGKGANQLRARITEALDGIKKRVQEETFDPTQRIDVTLPGVAPVLGHKHILTQIIDDICQIFVGLGFVVQEGPEMETEFHNFSALNIPVDHPSRDAFDTFYLESKDPGNPGRHLLLRSHTSPGQICIMEKYAPPLAVVIPGKVYRPDAVDASHSFMFHQIEGLLVDEHVKFSDLKGLLTVFCKRFFGEEIIMRFLPHFFPFTEPSAEVDISCYICKGKGCSVCGRKGWLEILGCGMVNPKVFSAVNYPKGKYTGLAFGLGVERMAMLKYGIHDIRIFFENDNRFLNQF